MAKSRKPIQRRARGELGELYKVLEKAFPLHLDKYGYLDLQFLAAELGIRKQSIYKWLGNDRVPAKRVNSLVALSKGKLSIKTLEPFIFS